MNALVKISYHLQLKTYDCAGTTVLKEGDPSEYIALIKDGEFQVCKEDMRQVDHRILEFLH